MKHRAFMKKTLYYILTGIIFLIASCSEGVKLYVSPDGNDAGLGTVDKPLRTLEGARQFAGTARIKHPHKKITVYFKGGEFLLEKAVKLSAGDSGSEKAPIVYKAMEGEIPVFTGGKSLSQWTKLTDETALKRLSPLVHGKIFVCDLASAGITHFGDPTEAGQRPELICNGRLQMLARWPNKDFVHAGVTKGETELPKTYMNVHGTKEGVFEYLDAYQDRWANEDDIRLGGYWYWDWSDQYQKVVEWDAGKRIVRLDEPYHSYGYKDSLRYFGLNLFCEIDQPGEWYLNRSTGKLYWYPPEGIDPLKAEVGLTCFSDSFMVELNDCSYITFEGLTFREGRGSAFKIEGGANNLLSGCRIERFGLDGVHITGGAGHGVSGCFLSAFGHGGFKIKGGDRKTLTPCNHFVEHTVVDNFSLFQRTYEPAIYLSGCGMRIANNRFTNSSSSAMRLDGNDFIIEYNEVSQVVNESDDQGGIDMWYNPSYRGVVIRYNHWSDITGGTECGAAGIRFDDMISGMLVYGNLFERCGAVLFGGVQIHGGKDNRIENNIFYECAFAVSFSPWGEKRWLQQLDSEVIREKIYSDVDINSEIYLKKYPELKEIRMNADVNSVTDNLMISCKKMFRSPQKNVMRNNTELEANGKSIEAFCTNDELVKYGLQPIPVEKIGPKNNLWLDHGKDVSFYVSPAGNDSNKGTVKKPFATLEKARDEIRKLRESGNKKAVVVFLRGGSYFLPDGIRFEAKDSGTETAPVVYKAFPNEKPILIGGKQIRNFTRYRGDIFKADMNVAGVGNVYFRQLIFGGERQHLARYPNFDADNPYGGGWAYAAGKQIGHGENIEGETKNEFDLEEKDYRNWKKQEEMEIMVLPRYNWFSNICRVRSIDAETRHVVLVQDASYAIRPGDRFYFRNAFEELDSPGEWYLDRETQTLYFWPPSPLPDKDVFVPTTRTILTLEEGTTDLVFSGLTFECSEGNGIEFTEASRCRIEGCTIRNVGDDKGSGVSINGGVKNVVFGCDIHYTGCHGITLMSSGDTGGYFSLTGIRKTLTPSEHVAENNYIHHIGVFNKHGIGISVDGCGQRVLHNLIHDTPRMAIIAWGNDHVIEYNHIRHVNLETSDTGAIYTNGRDWITGRGTVIRYNFMHDILGYGKDRTGKWVSPYYSWGVYLDDDAMDVDVTGNIIMRCQRAGVHLHNGRNNNIENNIIIDCTLQQMECNGWKENYYLNYLFPQRVQAYESVVDLPAWQKMRNIKMHPKDAVLPDKTTMSGNEFVRNIIMYREPAARYVRFNNFSHEHNMVDYNVIWAYGNPMLTAVRVDDLDEWDSWQSKGMDVHSVVSDPLFVDENGRFEKVTDFRLQPDSPALKLGFKPIPVDKIGPYKHDLRASWPVIEAEGAREKPLVADKASE